ncbi:MAG: Wzz/FepE/Etk N-terminal domain-containing protein [Bacteroidaceae bacterium]
MNEEQNSRVKVKEVDLIALTRKVWGRKRLIVKNCFIGGVLGIIIAFSIPKEYETKVTLVPEATGAGSSLSGSLSSLASLAGINLGSMGGGDDAVSPDLYPDVLKTTPFLVNLFNVQVKTKKGDVETSLYDYLEHHTRSSWFGYILSAPGKALGWLVGLLKEKEPKGDPAHADYFNLTRDQEIAVKTLQESITAIINKKTGVINLSVRMQDPLISAALADTIKDRLQTYIVDYRTRKARVDLAFTEEMYAEAEQNYRQAQQDYASFMDAHMDVVLQRYKIEEERLEKQVNMTYTIYNQVAQQLQLARMKVQQQTPVYAVIQPAVMSRRAASPKKLVILIAFCFMAFAGTLGWILFEDRIKLIWGKLLAK